MHIFPALSRTGPEVINPFSSEHEILTAHYNKDAEKYQIFLLSNSQMLYL